MKFVVVFAIAVKLIAQDSSMQQIACLVGADAKMAYGINVERYQNSNLALLYPVWFGANSISTLPVKKIIATLSDPSGAHSNVLILQGSSFSAQMLTAQPGQENSLRSYNGLPALALSPDNLVVVISSTLAVAGEADSVSHVLDRLGSTNCTGEIAAKISELDNSFDVWFVVLRPMEQINLASLMPEFKYQQELAESVVAVQGGIRIGSIHTVRAEVTTKNPDDAGALSVLGRWLPAMLENENSAEGKLVGAIENFETRASGSTASLSFLLPEAAVEAVQKAAAGKRFEISAEQ